MSSDYKYDAQVRAEELVAEQGLDFFDLSSEDQMKFYQQGLDETFERLISAADRE